MRWTIKRLGRLFALTFFCSGITQAFVYTGSLVYSNDVSYGFSADAINSSTGWRKFSLLEWTVSNEAPGGPGNGFDWFYSYTITADSFAPVRWVIETGAGFLAGDLRSVLVYDEGVLASYDPSNISFGWFANDNTESKPLRRDMPAERYGMFWEATSPGGNNTKSTTITFWSHVAPVWGDLYANCGGNGNLGFNSGFLADNPLESAANGSVENHVLVPGAIPEPAVISLLAGAGVTLLILRRLFERI